MQSPDAHAAAFDAVLAGGEDVQRLREGDVLLHLDERMEGRGRVVLETGTAFWTMIGPESVPASTKWTVTPATLQP